MTLTDILTISAIFLGPIVAIQVQKFLERANERRQKKTWIFSQLLATRLSKVSAEHVQALNWIELVFSKGGIRRNKLDEAVISAWKSYRSHLTTPYDEESFPVWSDNVNKLFADLLLQMSRALGYSFDKDDLERGAYSPVAHFNLEQDQMIIRQSVIAMLKGTQPVSVQLTIPEAAAKRQDELVKAVLAQAGPDGVLRVRVIADEREAAPRKPK